MSAQETLFQMVRFGLAGAALTLLMSAFYLLAMSLTFVSPQVSLISATLIASTLGYLVHSSYSFRGSGRRDKPAVRFFRFLATNVIGYLLNLFFVFALVDWAHLPKWTPVIPFCAVTPLLTFLLNRHWVFA